MVITLSQLKAMIKGGATGVIAAKDELTEVDSRFGDGDHGVTMEKVMTAVLESMASYPEDGGLKGLFDDLSMAVMTINGGAAVPLWCTLFEGMAEGAPDGGEATMDEFREMFRQGYETLAPLSKAKKGDKTMMDALEPAVEALFSTQGDLGDLLKAAARAAREGADSTARFSAKFGRAKNYGDQTIGTPDAGALSMASFFEGLAEGLER